MDTQQKVSEVGIQHSAAVVHPADTVMLCRTASVGLSVRVGIPMATTQAFVTWTCRPELDSRYLLLLLRAMGGEWKRLAYGSTHQTIYMPDLEALRVPLPPIAEQRRIADFLHSETARIDRITAVRQRQAKVEMERFESLREALVELAPGGVVQPLLRLTDPRRPINYGVLMPGERVEDGIPLIEAGDIMRGPIRIDSLRRTVPAIESEFSRSRLRADDLVMAIRGSVGGVQVVPIGSPGILNVTRDAARIAPAQAVVAGYLRHALLTRRVQDWLTLRLTGAAVKGFNIEDIRKVPVRISSEAEQSRIKRAVDEAEQHVSRVHRLMSQSVALLAERRQGLITAAVTGQLDVTTARGAA
jgi:type I restriction enzyme, S subunit